jgi:hypothetical protein
MTKSNASAQAAAVYGSTCEVYRTKGGLGGGREIRKEGGNPVEFLCNRAEKITQNTGTTCNIQNPQNEKTVGKSAS